MAAYRVYTIVKGSIEAAPAIFEAAADEDAIAQAKKMVDGHDVELWEGARFVIGLKAST